MTFYSLKLYKGAREKSQKLAPYMNPQPDEKVEHCFVNLTGDDRRQFSAFLQILQCFRANRKKINILLGLLQKLLARCISQKLAQFRLNSVKVFFQLSFAKGQKE